MMEARAKSTSYFTRLGAATPISFGLSRTVWGAIRPWVLAWNFRRMAAWLLWMLVPLRILYVRPRAARARRRGVGVARVGEEARMEPSELAAPEAPHLPPLQEVVPSVAMLTFPVSTSFRAVAQKYDVHRRIAASVLSVPSASAAAMGGFGPIAREEHARTLAVPSSEAPSRRVGIGPFPAVPGASALQVGPEPTERAVPPIPFAVGLPTIKPPKPSELPSGRKPKGPSAGAPTPEPTAKGGSTTLVPSAIEPTERAGRPVLPAKGLVGATLLSASKLPPSTGTEATPVFIPPQASALQAGAGPAIPAIEPRGARPPPSGVEARPSVTPPPHVPEAFVFQAGPEPSERAVPPVPSAMGRPATKPLIPSELPSGREPGTPRAKAILPRAIAEGGVFPVPSAKAPPEESASPIFPPKGLAEATPPSAPELLRGPKPEAPPSMKGGTANLPSPREKAAELPSQPPPGTTRPPFPSGAPVPRSAEIALAGSAGKEVPPGPPTFQVSPVALGPGAPAPTGQPPPVSAIGTLIAIQGQYTPITAALALPRSLLASRGAAAAISLDVSRVVKMGEEALAVPVSVAAPLGAMPPGVEELAEKALPVRGFPLRGAEEAGVVATRGRLPEHLVAPRLPTSFPSVVSFPDRRALRLVPPISGPTEGSRQFERQEIVMPTPRESRPSSVAELGLRRPVEGEPKSWTEARIRAAIKESAVGEDEELRELKKNLARILEEEARLYYGSDF